MNEITQTDLVGYTASVVVLISFLMKNVRRLRIINIVGCSLFVVFGFMIPSYPVVATNLAIALINIYYLTKKETPPTDSNA